MGLPMPGKPVDPQKAAAPYSLRHECPHALLLLRLPLSHDGPQTLPEFTAAPYLVTIAQKRFNYRCPLVTIAHKSCI